MVGIFAVFWWYDDRQNFPFYEDFSDGPRNFPISSWILGYSPDGPRNFWMFNRNAYVQTNFHMVHLSAEYPGGHKIFFGIVIVNVIFCPHKKVPFPIAFPVRSSI